MFIYQIEIEFTVGALQMKFDLKLSKKNSFKYI